MTTCAKLNMKPILWSIFWAIALLAAATFFKGSPALYWIEAAIYAGGITSILWKYERPDCPPR